MEQKNLPEQALATTEVEVNQLVIESQEKQLTELKELTASLVQSVHAMQAQTTRNAKFDDTLADLKATARAMLVPSIAPIANTQHASEKGCCGDQPCGCVSNDCCSFDIVMSYVRVLGMQTELDDSNLNPWGELEVRLFAYLDGGIGAVIPSMFSTLTLRKLLQHPGVKVSINRTIGTVYVSKGQTKLITIGVDAIEEDAGLIERVTGGRDEEGSNSSTMNLDCCCGSSITTSFDISFTSGGLGGGAIEVGFTAIKKC